MGKKKAEKAEKKVQKKKSGPATITEIDTTRLKALAKYATDNDDHIDFRLAASEKGAFRTELAKELKKSGTEDFDQMSDDDKGYCEGWLDLFRMEFGKNDAKLKEKVQKQVNTSNQDALSS